MSRNSNRSADSIFEKSDVNEIFPTALWILDLKRRVHEPLNRRLRGHIDESGAVVPA